MNEHPANCPDCTPLGEYAYTNHVSAGVSRLRVPRGILATRLYHCPTYPLPSLVVELVDSKKRYAEPTLVVKALCELPTAHLNVVLFPALLVALKRAIDANEEDAERLSVRVVESPPPKLSEVEGITLAEAKTRTLAALDEGIECPCCGQLAKRYRRSINWAMAVALVELYKHQRAHASEAWVHWQDLLAKKSVFSARGGDPSKLRFWGLVEAQVGTREDGSSRIGFYRITPKGRDFVEKKVSVPKHVHVYDNRAEHWPEDEAERITIRDALGTAFDYDRLMQGGG